MGTIASVLQWTCTNCNLINPTECLKCLKCGNIRHIRVDRVTDYDSNEDSTNDSRKHSIGRIQTTKSSSDNNQCNNNDNGNEDTIKFDHKTTNSTHFFHETRPGYVEVNSNGYI